MLRKQNKPFSLLSLNATTVIPVLFAVFFPHCYQLEQNVFTGVALSGYSLYARLYYPSMGIQ